VQEVRGCLGRAADAGEFGHSVRLDRELPARLDDRRADGVVPAACAERGDRAFIVAAREAQRILGKVRVVKLRFRQIGHCSPFPSGRLQNRTPSWYQPSASIRASVASSTTQRWLRSGWRLLNLRTGINPFEHTPFTGGTA